MSVEAAVQFMEKVATDEALRAQINKATEGKDEKAALAAVAAAGKAQGHDFTTEDVAQVRDGLIIELKQQSGEELSADELAKVSGGGGVFRLQLLTAKPPALTGALADIFRTNPAAFSGGYKPPPPPINPATLKGKTGHHPWKR